MHGSTINIKAAEDKRLVDSFTADLLREQSNTSISNGWARGRQDAIQGAEHRAGQGADYDAGYSFEKQFEAIMDART